MAASVHPDQAEVQSEGLQRFWTKQHTVYQNTMSRLAVQLTYQIRRLLST